LFSCAASALKVPRTLNAAPAPAGSCPNPKWTATVTDVAFTTATLSLFEDSTLSDTETVPVT
jgi:hypothetical protein